mgnify:CR=1 FL=1
MFGKKSEERRIVWWNLLAMTLMTVLSFALVNAEGEPFFFGLVAVLFLCVGVLIKRPYVFIGIMILTIVLVFIVKDGFFGILSDGNDNIFNFNFFINSNK